MALCTPLSSPRSPPLRLLWRSIPPGRPLDGTGPKTTSPRVIIRVDRLLEVKKQLPRPQGMHLSKYPLIDTEHYLICLIRTLSLLRPLSCIGVGPLYGG